MIAYIGLPLVLAAFVVGMVVLNVKARGRRKRLSREARVAEDTDAAAGVRMW